MTAPSDDLQGDDLQGDDLQGLAAGYVLGDLSSEEMVEFQARMATDPQLTQLVTDLQETLTLLPYGMNPTAPHGRVRSQLLTQAAAASPPASIATSIAQPSNAQPSNAQPHILRTLAASLMLMAGLSLLLTHRVTRLQTQLASRVQPSPAAIIDTSRADSSITIQPAESMLSQQWGGLTQLVQDHTGSLARSHGPVDLHSSQPDQLLQQLAIELMPTLTTAQAQLLGGSPCQFDQTKGIRLTYQLPHQQTVSVYQIDLNGNQFPALLEAHVTVTYHDVNLILWRENNYLYAIAASMPVNELEDLIQSVTFI